MRKTVDKKFIKALGSRLAEVRKQKNVTQEQLAEDANLSLSQIARIETGVINTSVNNIYIIAKALDVQPKILFDFE